MASLEPNWWLRKDLYGWIFDGLKPEDVRIVSAAIKIKKPGYKGLILPGARHFSPAMRQWMQYLIVRTDLTKEDFTQAEQGFVDQYDRFWTREEAAEIVTLNGQPLREPLRGRQLFSEDLY